MADRFQTGERLGVLDTGDMAMVLHLLQMAVIPQRHDGETDSQSSTISDSAA